MESQNSTRKSHRYKQKSVFLEHYVQDEVLFNDDFETLDEMPLDDPDLIVKQSTHVQFIVQCGTLLTSSVTKEEISEDQGKKKRKKSSVNSKLEDKKDQIDEDPSR